MFEKSGSEALLPELTRLNDMGYFRIKEEDFTKAKALLHSALKISEDSRQHPEILAKIYSNLGWLYDLSGQPDSSILMYEKGLELEPLKNFDKKYIQTADLLYEHYKDRSPEKQEHYYQMIYTYGKELSQLRRQLMEASYEYQIRAADYRRELDLRIAKEKRMLLWDMFWYSLALMGVTSCIVFYLIEKRKRRKRLRKALDNVKIIVPVVRT